MTKKTNSSGFRNTKQQVRTAEGRKMSSIKWLNRHINDPFVNMAKAQNYRSRAAFKIDEILKSFPQFKAAKVIIDLGAAPGGWLQIFSERCPKATIIGLDLKEIPSLPNVTTIVGDFLEDETLERLQNELGGELADLVVSDMAANSCGDSEIDHLRNVALIEQSLEFCENNLAKGGNFVAKFLRGRDESNLIQTLRNKFTSVKQFKPKSSYSDSSEIYLVALKKR